MNPDDKSVEELTVEQLGSIAAFGDAINTFLSVELPEAMGKMGTAVGNFHDRLSWRARGVNISEEAIENRSLRNMAVKAQRVRDQQKGVKKRPKFICPKHRKPMVFSTAKQVWYCQEAGCYESRMPEIDRTETHVIKSKPRLIGREDQDGDIHWYVNFPDEGILIEVSFGKGVVQTNNGGGTLLWDMEDMVVFDKRGKESTVVTEGD